MKLYENIKSLRTERGWSQQKLAEMTGYTDRSSIAKIEAGLVDLPQTKIEQFAKVFGVSPVELMGFKPQADYIIEMDSEISFLLEMLDENKKRATLDFLKSMVKDRLPQN